MQLEDYFEFLGPDDIRIKGHRVGIENVLIDYVETKRTPEQIQERYPHLTLEQVYATILYYLRNQETVNEYLTRHETAVLQLRKQFAENPPPFVKRLKRERLVSSGHQGT